MIAFLLCIAMVFADECIKNKHSKVITQDGAAICIEHLPAKGSPIILAHGISSNHKFWNLNTDYSLALYLQQQGFDVYNIDFRGHGYASHDAKGKKQHGGWSIDSYGVFDIDAAIKHVQKTHPQEEPIYIAHSLGGMALISYMAQHDSSALKAIVIVGTPFDFRHPDPLLHLAKIGAGISFFTIPSPFLAHIASLFHRTPAGIDTMLWGDNTMSTKVRKEMYRSIVSPMTPKELQQIAKTLSKEAYSPLEGDRSYAHVLQKQNIPALFLAGRADRVAPVDRVLGYYNQLGSTHKKCIILGKEYGFSINYGHLDYALAKAAPQEIFPLITQWISQLPP